MQAALDADEDPLGAVIEWVFCQVGRRSHHPLSIALDEVVKRCLQRALRVERPELGDYVPALASANDVDQLRRTASGLRSTTLSLRSMLTDPLLGARVIAVGGTVFDPEGRRLELADLAVDVLTAVDYLLATQMKRPTTAGFAVNSMRAQPLSDSAPDFSRPFDATSSPIVVDEPLQSHNDFIRARG